MNKPISLIMILLVWEIVGFGAIQPGRLIHVPNIKGIFSITVSPVGSEVLFYGSRDELEGEILSGSLFRLNLNSQKFSVVHINATQASNPTTPVWQADGSAAFFQCDDGIYKLYSNNIIPKLIWRGIAEGMAISKNEKFLVIKGQALIELRDIYSKEIIQYNVNGNNLEIVEMIPGYTHNITNTGDEEMVLLIWANESYNPVAPDTNFIEV